MKNITGTLLFIFLSVFSFNSYADVDDWTKVTSYADLRDIAFGNGVFVAVSQGAWIDYYGQVYISSDGIEWKIQEPDIEKSFSKIVYGDGKFVATGLDTGVSIDGINWTIQVKMEGNGVAYGNGLFVLVNDDGYIATSPDGESWTQQTSNTTVYLTSVVYGNNEFVAVGRDKTIIKSTDGISWHVVNQQSQSAVALASSTSDIYSIQYNQGRYYARLQSTLISAQSVDFWQEEGFNLDTFQGQAVASDGSQQVTFLGQQSSDGRLWTLPKFDLANSSSDKQLNAIAYGNDTFVAVGDNSQIYTSIDGEHWQMQRGGSNSLINITDDDDVIFVNNRFYFADGEYIRISYDGIHVEHSILVNTDSDDVRALTFANSQFVAVTKKGSIYTSTDGFIWQKRLTQEAGKYFQDVEFGNGLYIAVGNDGSIFTSESGVDWINSNNDIVGLTDLFGITYGSTGFVTVGQSGKVFTSSDGINWSTQTSGITQYLYSISYAHDTYVAVGNSGTHLISIDGIMWTNMDSGSRNFKKIVATSQGFIAVASSGVISESFDYGQSWEETDLGKQALDDVVIADNASFIYDGHNIYVKGSFTPKVSQLELDTVVVHQRGSSAGASDLAFGNGRFVAVGGTSYESSWASSHPFVAVSFNGKQWRVIPDVPFISREIVFHDGRFIAAGDDNAFYYSLDGITWSKGNSYQGVSYIRDLKYIGGRFVAVGRHNLVMTSSDGDNWDINSFDANNTLPSWGQVAYSNGRYVAIDGDQLLMSDDGKTWISNTPVKLLDDNQTETVSFLFIYAFRDCFYAGFSGEISIHSSTDGINWSFECPIPETYTDGEPIPETHVRPGLMYLQNGQSVALKGSGDLDPEGMAGDVDGGDFGYSSYLNIAYGNDVFVVVSDDDFDKALSTNGGENWQRVEPFWGNGIRYLNGQLLRSVPFSDSVQRSEDLGITWRTVWDVTPEYDVDLVDFAYHNGLYIAVSDYSGGSSADDHATIYSSTDTINWTSEGGINDSRETPVHRLGFKKIIYAKNQFIAVGEYGLIATSSDGLDWVQQNSNSTVDLKDITYGHEGFVVVGGDKTIFHSPNGVTWTQITNPVNYSLNSINYHEGVYIAAGYSGILRSIDGINWTQVWYSYAADYLGISVGELGFIVGYRSGYRRSVDGGKTWIWFSSAATNSPMVQVGKHIFMANGNDSAPDGVTTIMGFTETYDADDDNILSENDNCKFYPNIDQANNDNDNLGDVCDDDDDNDGLLDITELALGTNPKQADSDGDGSDDATEISLGTDPLDSNDVPGQTSSSIIANDSNGDGYGDILWRNNMTGDNRIWLMQASETLNNILISNRGNDWEIVARGDFNGDSFFDIFWRNSTTGDNAIDYLSGGDLLASVNYRFVSLGWRIAGSGDLDGDGITDLIWQSNDTGKLYVHIVLNGQVINESYIGSTNTDWQVSGLGDFNGDGKADIWLRNTSTGDNRVWLMDGVTQVNNTLVNTIPSSWKLLAIGDVNNDDHAVVMWRNQDTEQTYIYMIKDGGIDEHGALGSKSLDWQFNMVNDLDGDGSVDMIWRHKNTGEVQVDYISNYSVTSSDTLGTLTSADWQIVPNSIIAAEAKKMTLYDFDGDSKADVLWRNEMTGDTYLWTMSGADTKQRQALKYIPLSWSIAGRGDFDGDSKADILWRHNQTGRNYLWLMDGTMVKSTHELNSISDLSWQIKEVADFDGDGKSDIFWHHQISGKTYVWLMDSYTVKSAKGVITLADIDWQVAGSGDMNGDGKSDILWRHKLSGINYVWLMDGDNTQDRYTLNTISNAWHIAGFGDLNNDGTDDIIWRNQQDGRNWAYLMKNGQVTTSQQINKLSDSLWKIKQVSDFDGDGNADLFWRHQGSGKTYIYFMNGALIRNSSYSVAISNTDWQVVN